jgi:gamma-glutamylcyclotransferase (GGCT)/AIG2-like uncharacterized protein YtfP
MTKQYPFFVYGTLIPGQPNDFYWEDCIGDVKPAVLPNGRLYDLGSFPMLLEGGDRPVIGQIMVPRPGLSGDSYKLLVERLDSLENYNPEDIDNSPYYRVLRTVFGQDNQPITAWLYLGRPKFTQDRPLIPGGDWAKHSANAATPIADWWQERGEALLFSEDEDW